MHGGQAGIDEDLGHLSGSKERKLGGFTRDQAAFNHAVEQVAERIRSTYCCGLCQTRKNAVPGEGSATAKLVLVGEIGLSGELRSVSQLERRLSEAAKLGFDVPADRRDPPGADAAVFIRSFAVGSPACGGGNRNEAVASCALRIDGERAVSNALTSKGMTPKRGPRPGFH